VKLTSLDDMSISDTRLPFCSMKECCAPPVDWERPKCIAFRIDDDGFGA
jgi:hypothetical protein